MSRSNMNDAQLNSVVVNGLKAMTGVMTLAGAITWDLDYGTVVAVDPGGATRVVTLPAASEANEGAMFFIINIADAAEDLTINNESASTIGTFSQNEMGVIVNIRGTWYARVVGLST